MNLQTKIMRRATSQTALGTYVAALEWNLVDPIVIRDRNDLKSEARWQGRIEPFHHQVTNLITYCRRLPVTLLADDVGLGKTISAGLIISELSARQRLQKILIVCPKILGPQWREELDSKFGISSEILRGNSLFREDPDVDAVITTYNSARLYLDRIPRDRFQMLILDEAHKLRNLFGVENPPQVAITFKKALEERRFPYVLMLTATPIQNRLWDLYSLVDLLSVARGHPNPFGSPGMFARRFIADDRERARRLKLEAQKEFRDIVYGYMSRVRRDDAKLYFPDRVVQMHRITPSPVELQLIAIVGKEIEEMNALVQISILQALASSPEALSAQLLNMSRKGTIGAEFAYKVRDIVKAMPTPAKLRGLGALIDQLRAEKPGDWRVVIFTTRRETQTSIEVFLTGLGIKVGIINGSTGGTNQENIAKLRASPPELNVIISTEAGSEGVNLQAANVLVNYDLPWNPMIVEQRIGRVQRLASAHKSVAIFNVILEQTFEEYIVGRLMEKLQMASHAIGDLESLLEASGAGDGSVSFEEKVRRLVMAALQGKDAGVAVKLETESIDKAREELESERDNINSLLGDSAGPAGPSAPELPPTKRSMPPSEFVPAAFEFLGATVTTVSASCFRVVRDGITEVVSTEPTSDAVHYAPDSQPFARLVDEVIASGLHSVDDADENSDAAIASAAHHWLSQFNGRYESHQTLAASRAFEGYALIRVRANVKHDSYERLVPLEYKSKTPVRAEGRSALTPIPSVLQKLADIGIDGDDLAREASEEAAVAEFCRFYLERRAIEVASAGEDQRRAAKLHEDFTPRLEMSVVALKGRVWRSANVNIGYKLADGHSYASSAVITPFSGALAAPEIVTCALSQQAAPSNCMGLCEVSKDRVLRHHLVQSEVSGRWAKAEHTIRCALSGKRAFSNELIRSGVTGNWVVSGMLLRDPINGLVGEPEHFGTCEFTQERVLLSNLATSGVSGKQYRVDQAATSSVSSRTGHASEFETCEETRRPIAKVETEVCAVTGMRVRPGILEESALTGQRMHPSQLLTCAYSGSRAGHWLFSRSSLSERPILTSHAVFASNGAACLPDETVRCAWTGQSMHPADLRTCELTRLQVSAALLSPVGALRPLIELLDGVKHSTDHVVAWDTIAEKLSTALNGTRCRIVNAIKSPEGQILALRGEVKTMLGLKTRHVGALYSLSEGALIGRITAGRMTPQDYRR